VVDPWFIISFKQIGLLPFFETGFPPEEKLTSFILSGIIMPQVI
jgi:hypothetical protein